MVAVSDTKRTAEFLISEANGYRSREERTAALGGTALVAGTLLGRLSAGGNYVPYVAGAATGAEIVSGILFQSGVGTALQTIIVRDAEVNLAAITYTGVEATVTAGLNALGIAVRKE
jgi:hypothetical protein